MFWKRNALYENDFFLLCQHGQDWIDMHVSTLIFKNRNILLRACSSGSRLPFLSESGLGTFISININKHVPGIMKEMLSLSFPFLPLDRKKLPHWCINRPVGDLGSLLSVCLTAFLRLFDAELQRTDADCLCFSFECTDIKAGEIPSCLSTNSQFYASWPFWDKQAFVFGLHCRGRLSEPIIAASLTNEKGSRPWETWKKGSGPVTSDAFFVLPFKSSWLYFSSFCSNFVSSWWTQQLPILLLFWFVDGNMFSKR